MINAERGSGAGGWSRLAGIDVLRGLAILFVLLNHVNMRLVIAKFPYTDGLPDQLVSSLVWNGQYGVQIFFAISGFLITSMSLRRWGLLARICVRDFYVLRFARIAPLLVLLLITLALLHFTQSEWFFVPPKVGGLGGALLAALTFHINVLEAQRGYLPANWDVLWSLSVEEVFYLGFPIACLLLGRGRLLVIFLAFLVITGPFARTVMAGHSETWREYSYLGGMDAIALGCLTAILEPRIFLSGSGQRAVLILGAVLMLLVLGFSTLLEHLGLMRAGLDMTIAALGTCLLILAVAKGDSNVPAFARPLLWLGRRSYEVYLTHMFVVIGLFVTFTEFGKPLSGVPILFVTAILISVLLGEVVGRLYSEPMNRVLRMRMGGAAKDLGMVIETSDLASAKRSVIEARTVQAYRETEYRAHGHEPLALRIGEVSLKLAGAHKRQGVDCSAYITACNPFSRILDDATNLERHAALGRELRQRSLAYMEGIGRHPSNEWPDEVSYLIFGLTLEAAKTLAERLEQNAIVWAGVDAVPQLILLR